MAIGRMPEAIKQINSFQFLDLKPDIQDGANQSGAGNLKFEA